MQLVCDVTSALQAVKTYGGNKKQQLSDLVSEIVSEETLPPRPKHIVGGSSPFPQPAHNKAQDKFSWHEDDDQFETMANLPVAPPQRNKLSSYFQSAGSGSGRVSASVARSGHRLSSRVGGLPTIGGRRAPTAGRTGPWRLRPAAATVVST